MDLLQPSLRHHLLLGLFRRLGVDLFRKYGGYEDYLIERRFWFLGLIALITLMDLIDTSLKGTERWDALGIAYVIQTGTGMILVNKGASRPCLDRARLSHGLLLREYFKVTA